MDHLIARVQLKDNFINSLTNVHSISMSGEVTNISNSFRLLPLSSRAFLAAVVSVWGVVGSGQEMWSVMYLRTGKV